MSSELIQGFSPEDTERVSAHLEKLLPYLRQDAFTIVGGLAIRYHLATHKIAYPQRAFNDLDIMVDSLDAVSTAVIDNFLVEHYHPPIANAFYLVLIDPGTKTKVDTLARCF